MSYVRRLSSLRLVCGHVWEAYQWLAEHPVTLQSRLSLVEGHSHVTQGREEEWTGVEAGTPLSLRSWGELFPQDQTSSESWEDQGALNLIWRDGLAEIEERREESEKGREVYCFCAGNSKACHVFIFLLPLFPATNFSRLPTPQLEDMIAFPCWVPMLRFSTGQVSPVCVTSIQASNETEKPDPCTVTRLSFIIVILIIIYD